MTDQFKPAEFHAACCWDKTLSQKWGWHAIVCSSYLTGIKKVVLEEQNMTWDVVFFFRNGTCWWVRKFKARPQNSILVPLGFFQNFWLTPLFFLGGCLAGLQHVPVLCLYSTPHVLHSVCWTINTRIVSIQRLFIMPQICLTFLHYFAGEGYWACSFRCIQCPSHSLLSAC